MKEKAVFYARVSTDEEKQVNALAKQVQECKDTIKANGWKCVDSYIDEGKSGTTSKRDEYQRLCADISTDKYDIIVIKSQDRLMRNAKDWYIFVDLLVQNHKKLYMYLENKYYQSDDALITGIKAILAAEYSHDLSKKINNANRRRQQSASSIITNGKLWGYDQKDGQLTINEEQAKVVRRIFELYNQGYGCRNIQKILHQEGITTDKGKDIQPTTIKRMIINPNYIGTVVFNRTHKDFETKKLIENPKSEWIIHENRIPAIIDMDTWNTAQANFNARRKHINADGRVDNVVGYNKPVHPIGGKIICGLCGKVYYRVRHVSRYTGQVSYQWQCSTYNINGRLHPKMSKNRKINESINPMGCDGRNLSDEFVTALLDEILKHYELNNDQLFDVICKMLDDDAKLDKESNPEQIQKLKKEIESNNTKKSFLLDKYMSGIVSDSDYTKKNAELETAIHSAEQRINDYEAKQQNYEQQKKQLEEYKNNRDSNFINEAKYQMIKQIVVYPDKIHVKMAIETGIQDLDIPLSNGSRYGPAPGRKYVQDILRFLFPSICSGFCLDNNRMGMD